MSTNKPQPPHWGEMLPCSPGHLQRSPGARKSLAGATAHGIRWSLIFPCPWAGGI